MNKNTKALFEAIKKKKSKLAINILNRENPWYVSAGIGLGVMLNVIILAAFSLATFPIAFPILYFFSDKIAQLVTWPQRVLSQEVDKTARVSGMTSLHLSAKKGLVSVVKSHYGEHLDFLTGDDVLDPKDAGLTALHIAILNDDVEMIKELFTASPALLSKSGESALGLAVRLGNIETVKALITYGNGHPRYGLEEAMSSSSCETLDYLTPLELAIQHKNIEMLKLLLPFVTESMINELDHKDRTPLIVALFNSPEVSVETVGLLLDHGAAVDMDVEVTSKGMLVQHLYSRNKAPHSEDLSEALALCSAAFKQRISKTD